MARIHVKLALLAGAALAATVPACSRMPKPTNFFEKVAVQNTVELAFPHDRVTSVVGMTQGAKSSSNFSSRDGGTAKNELALSYRCTPVEAGSFLRKLETELLKVAQECGVPVRVDKPTSQTDSPAMEFRFHYSQGNKHEGDVAVTLRKVDKQSARTLETGQAAYRVEVIIEETVGPP